MALAHHAAARHLLDQNLLRVVLGDIQQRRFQRGRHERRIQPRHHVRLGRAAAQVRQPRQQQEQTTAMYMSYMGSADNIWDQTADEDSGRLTEIRQWKAA